jgi:hypothetical protein
MRGLPSLIPALRQRLRYMHQIRAFSSKQLDNDRRSSLAGTVKPYNQHVLLKIPHITGMTITYYLLVSTQLFALLIAN